MKRAGQKPRSELVANPTLFDAGTGAGGKPKASEGSGSLKTFSETLALGPLDRAGLRAFADLVADRAPLEMMAAQKQQALQFDSVDAQLTHLQMGTVGWVD
jgi:hypothetical protein